MPTDEFLCYVVLGVDPELGILEPVKAFAEHVQATAWARENLGVENYSIKEVPVGVPKNTMLERRAKQVPGIPCWVTPEFMEDLLHRVIRGDRFITRFPDDRQLRFRFVGHDDETMRMLFHAETDALREGATEFLVEFRTVGEQAVTVTVRGAEPPGEN